MVILFIALLFSPLIILALHIVWLLMELFKH